MRDFKQHIAALKAKRETFRREIEETFARDGRYVISPARHGKTAVLLTKNIGETPLRVTYFDADGPTGHIEVRDFDEAVSVLSGWRPQITAEVA